ncbi:MAG: hypothetical protein ACRDZM_16955 [Acidimicrobiia bacterium]
MAVETHGTVQMRGESGPGIPVDIQAEGPHLRLLSGTDAIGDWDVGAIGIQSLNDGFAIRAEGEELILKTEDDVAIAQELGIAAGSLRLVRMVAASQKPEERIPPPEPTPPKSNIGAIVYALGGVLVLSGGFFLREDPTMTAVSRSASEGLQAGGRFWLAFVIGGLLMAGTAFALAVGARWARAVAVLALVGLVVVFGIAAQSATPEAGFLLAYGFIAGGIVVGVAVLVGGSLGDNE